MWCSKTTKIQEGDVVTISYIWTLENWEIFENETKTITIGSWNIIRWIEKKLLKKKLNQKFSIDIKPEDWYGNQYSIYNKQEISAFVFDRLWFSKEIWSIIKIDKTKGKVIEHKYDEQENLIIVFDINEPQTRQNTKYNIHIENIQKQQKPEWYEL